MARQTPESTEDIESLPLGVRLLSLLAGLTLMALGGKSLFDDSRILYKLTHLDSEYRETPARMLQVRLRRDTSEAGDKYYPDVLFEYFVEGQSVWGWRFSLEEEPRPKAYWEKRLEGYHARDSVTVHVSPDDPKDSFVEKKRDSLLRPALKVLVAGAFVLFGALLFTIPLAVFLGKAFGALRGRRQP